MKTSTLRFGNPLCMNDSAEITWLLEMVRAYILERDQYKEIIYHWELVEKAVQIVLQTVDLPYIFCLSKENDVLSQWRSYADDGKGIALGIDVDMLLKISDLLQGSDIIYDKKEQINLLNGIISKKVLDNLEHSIKSNDIKDILAKSTILISHILEKAVVCKNPAFQEEKEYRISCKPVKSTNNNVSEIKFRTSSGSIIPYREICFGGIKHSLIKNITIGPKSMINNRNLWLFLESQNFKWKEWDKDWSLNDARWRQHVKISEATYR